MPKEERETSVTSCRQYYPAPRLESIHFHSNLTYAITFRVLSDWFLEIFVKKGLTNRTHIYIFLNVVLFFKSAGAVWEMHCYSVKWKWTDPQPRVAQHQKHTRTNHLTPEGKTLKFLNCSLSSARRPVPMCCAWTKHGQNRYIFYIYTPVRLCDTGLQADITPVPGRAGPNHDE